MPAVPTPDSLLTKLTELEGRLRALETAPQAPYTSISDAGGVEVVRLSEDGLVIANGAIEVGGGPVRALDLAYWEGQNINSAFTTTPSKFGVATITPPAWATTVVAQALVMFQMTNTSGAVQQLEFRATVNGIPSSGVYTASAPVAAVINVVDYFQATLTRGVDFTTSFECAGYAGVQAGTNNANVVRTKATVYYLR